LSLNVLILGPQGSGKGTQAARIASEYGIPHIATGEMFRDAIGAGTPLGREVEPILASGALVPDELTIRLMRERLSEADAQAGFIVDGFPRNGPQAEALDELLDELDRPLDVVLDLQVPDEVSMERLLGRAEREGRADDSPEVIAKRLEIFHRETEPLIGYYLPRGIVVGIHGDRSRDEVWSEIVEALERVRERAAGREGACPRSGQEEGVRGNFEAEDKGGSEAASLGTRQRSGAEGVNRVKVPPGEPAGGTR
jgi:adenylate kinase